MDTLTLERTDQALQPGMKRILIKFAGGLKPPQEVMIGPGTNSFDLLNQLGLDGTGYQLSKGTPDSTFGTDEILYPNINDGDLLYVTSMVDAGL